MGKNRAPVLIEQTSKQYKLIILIGAMLMCGGALSTGLLMQFFTTQSGEVVAALFGGGMTLVGLVMWFGGTIAAWWNHS